MFTSFYLKRMLPFVLTFVVGIALGGFFNHFARVRRVVSFDGVRLYREGRGCRTPRRAWRQPDNTRRAVITFQPSPRYTAEAIRNNYTGQARLRVLLGADGRVAEVEPLDALPYGLTEEAVRAAREIRFTPANVNGVPVEMWAYVQQDFVDARRMTAISQEVREFDNKVFKAR